MGMGVDVRGGDYTKAACRAVFDAIHHSSLNFFEAAGRSADEMLIDVHIGVAQPDQVDIAAVAAELPYGSVTVHTTVGGLDVPSTSGDGMIVSANAMVLVSFPNQD